MFFSQLSSTPITGVAGMLSAGDEHVHNITTALSHLGFKQPGALVAALTNDSPHPVANAEHTSHHSTTIAKTPSPNAGPNR